MKVQTLVSTETPLQDPVSNVETSGVAAAPERGADVFPASVRLLSAAILRAGPNQGSPGESRGGKNAALFFSSPLALHVSTSRSTAEGEVALQALAGEKAHTSAFDARMKVSSELLNPRSVLCILRAVTMSRLTETKTTESRSLTTIMQKHLISVFSTRSSEDLNTDRLRALNQVDEYCKTLCRKKYSPQQMEEFQVHAATPSSIVTLDFAILEYRVNMRLDNLPIAEMTTIAWDNDMSKTEQYYNLGYPIGAKLQPEGAAKQEVSSLAGEERAQACLLYTSDAADDM
eukprot:1275380-Rhodomonas_salina.2